MKTMEFVTTERGFRAIEALAYLENEVLVLVQESSRVGNYDDALRKPGSSFLWVGRDHHLSREEVKILMDAMGEWLKTGRLPEDLNASMEAQSKSKDHE